MLKVDDSQLPRKYKRFLEEWAKLLGVPVPDLILRIVVATIDGFLYIEKIPNFRP